MNKFIKIDTYSFNILLCIIAPAIAYLLINDHYALLTGTRSLWWLLSKEFLQLVAIILCYSLPLAWFGSKLYELFKGDAKRLNIALLLISALFLPFGMILLFVIAKANFTGVILLAITTLTMYIRSYMPVLQKVPVKK